MKLSMEQYQQHVDSMDGFCVECDDFTRQGETELDAEEYECPQCEQNTCKGAEMAMVEGDLDIVD